MPLCLCMIVCNWVVRNCHCGRNGRHTLARKKKTDGCWNIYCQFVIVLCSPLPDWTHVLEEERWSEGRAKRRWDNEEGGKGRVREGWNDGWGLRVVVFSYAYTHAERSCSDPALWRSGLDASPNSSSWTCKWQLCNACCCQTFSAVTGNLMTMAEIYSTAPEWFITEIKRGSFICTYNLTRCSVPLSIPFNEILHTAVLLFQKHADMTLSHTLRFLKEYFHEK